MTTLTEQQMRELKASIKNPCHEFWLDGTELDRTDRAVLKNRIETLIHYATGKLDLCEVSMVLSEVAEEFEEEAAS